MREATRKSTVKLSKVHILPSERACALIERLFADGRPMSRTDLLNHVLADITWNDELVLVRPLRFWVDRLLTLLCSAGCMRRGREGTAMTYVPTELWSEADQVLRSFQHPTPGKRTAPSPTSRRRISGTLPCDSVIYLEDWKDARISRHQHMLSKSKYATKIVCPFPVRPKAL